MNDIYIVITPFVFLALFCVWRHRAIKKMYNPDQGDENRYDIYRFKKIKFYGLCGFEYFYIGYESGSPYTYPDNGSLVEWSVDETQAVDKYNCKMLISKDYIIHNDNIHFNNYDYDCEEYKPLDFK